MITVGLGTRPDLLAPTIYEAAAVLYEQSLTIIVSTDGFLSEGRAAAGFDARSFAGGQLMPDQRSIRRHRFAVSSLGLDIMVIERTWHHHDSRAATELDPEYPRTPVVPPCPFAR